MLQLSLAALALTTAVMTVHPVEGDENSAYFLANEAVMVTSGDLKVLFDPFFSHFGDIQPVPRRIKRHLMAAEHEFEGVDVIFVSHVHDDHFDAEEMNAYLVRHPQVVLVAPSQARPAMEAAYGWQQDLAGRIVALPFIAEPMGFAIGNQGDPAAIAVEAVHIPHAGGFNWSGVQNMVYRVTLSGDTTVMHLGDATPDEQSFADHVDHFQRTLTDRAFPPYWLITEWGGDETRSRLNADQVTGIHVPQRVPVSVQASREDFFTEPGEVRAVHGHDREDQ